jgi:A/G-specific adenine glycosylase
MRNIEEKRQLFGYNLLLWRQKNNPDSIFPWRNTDDPYEILVTECLLKKTNRTQVANIWAQFVEHFPDVYSLKKSDKRSLKKIIKPLGMMNIRADMLKNLAQKIIENYNGEIPETKEELLKLPGVGSYVANAVLSFAFNKDVSMIDTNIMRVLHRVFSLNSEMARARSDKKIWEFAENLPPTGTGRNFNLAILDFAGMVCKSKNPKCKECIMNKMCDYNLGSRNDTYPRG